MKFKPILAFIFAAVSVCYAEKFAYIGCQKLSQGNSAILGGAKNTASEISKSSNSDFRVELCGLPDSPAAQIAALDSAFLRGFSGAIIAPAASDAALYKRIDYLQKRGFSVAVVGSGLDSAAVVGVATDAAKTARAVENALSRLGAKTEIFCYFKGSSGAHAAHRSLPPSELLHGKLSSADFERIFSPRPYSLVECSFYGVYAAENAESITRRDDYCEIFFSPELLSDMAPIKPDRDRVFAICIGALPHLEYYLQSGQIDCCIYDDFYGWGVYAVRSLIAVRRFDASAKSLRLPPPERKLVAPVVVGKKNWREFSRDWNSWQ